MGLNSQDVASNKEEEEPSGSYCEDGLLFKVLLHAVLLLFFAELVLPPLKKKKLLKSISAWLVIT